MFIFIIDLFLLKEIVIKILWVILLYLFLFLFIRLQVIIIIKDFIILNKYYLLFPLLHPIFYIIIFLFPSFFHSLSSPHLRFIYTIYILLYFCYFLNYYITIIVIKFKFIICFLIIKISFVVIICILSFNIFIYFMTYLLLLFISLSIKMILKIFSLPLSFFFNFLVFMHLRFPFIMFLIFPVVDCFYLIRLNVCFLLYFPL
jgi:hypothetical protein